MAPYLDLIVWIRGTIATLIFKNDRKYIGVPGKYDSIEVKVMPLLSLVVLSR